MLRFDTKYAFNRPVGYGLIVATLGSVGYLHMGLPELFDFDAGISEVITGGIFVGLVLILLRQSFLENAWMMGTVMKEKCATAACANAPPHVETCSAG